MLAWLYQHYAEVLCMAGCVGRPNRVRLGILLLHDSSWPGSPQLAVTFSYVLRQQDSWIVRYYILTGNSPCNFAYL